MYVSADKAVRELGLVQTSVEQALRDAVDWFVSHDYASSRQPRKLSEAWLQASPGTDRTTR
jgi:hypothetical protein